MSDLVALAILAALQVADIRTTRAVLARGGVEKNPVVAWLMERFGPLWWAPKLAVAALGAGLIVLSGATWALWPLNAVYVAIVLWNMRAAGER